MSTPLYPEPHPHTTIDGQPLGTRPPIKYVWPKRIAVVLVGLALVGGIGFGVKTLLDTSEPVATSRETVQSPSPAPAASRAPTAPMRLSLAVTDSAGALSSEQLAEVTSAVERLQNARDVRLWVVYVDAFDGPPAEWANKTVSLTTMGDRDAILAIATTQRAYAFLVGPAAANGSRAAVDDLRRDRIEPQLRDNDFAGAAITAATGLEALG